MIEISEYHAHVYFDESSYDQAEKLCQTAAEKFKVKMGRLHQKPVGPHPCWSCLLTFDPSKFGELIPWLAVNRQGLTVFIHPESGNDLVDHTEYAIWMGTIEELRLDIFNIDFGELLLKERILKNQIKICLFFEGIL